MIKYRTGEPGDVTEMSALLSSFQSELVVEKYGTQR